MSDKLRYGDFASAMTINQVSISYNELTPKIAMDADGNELPYVPPKLSLTPRDLFRVLEPYINVRVVEQLRSVVPLALYLALFQLLILRTGVTDAGLISGGVIAVILGLVLFMEGLKLGLMPFGESIGTVLPAKAALSVVMMVALLLGVGVTFAEPAIGALQAAGSMVTAEDAPYLWALLNPWSGTLVLSVGVGVGLAAVLGMLRFIYNWSLKPLIYLTLVPALGLLLYLLSDPQLSKTIGMAWDCGAVTTGPVTVPLVLSLGIGVAAATGKGDTSLSGFGIVTLASLFPIIAVMLLVIYLASTVSPEQIIQQAAVAQAEIASAGQWYQQTPWVEAIGGFRAIVPLVLFLLFVIKVVLRESVHNAGIVTYGIVLCVVGMVIFNIGLSYGLSKLGGQSGGLVPAAFATVNGVDGSPLYGFLLGLMIAGAFAWFLGYGSTLAEPALNALGITVETLTNGAFKKSLLMNAVAFGVGCGIAAGTLRMVFDLPLAWFLIPTYLLAAVLTALSTEEFVNVAWDSAGVTTGPVTVPLVLAMGLGFGNSTAATDGFGILSMASIGPILTVLSVGLMIQLKLYRQRQAEVAEGHSNEKDRS